MYSVSGMLPSMSENLRRTVIAGKDRSADGEHFAANGIRDQREKGLKAGKRSPGTATRVLTF